MSEIQSLARGLKILDILGRSQDGASITKLAGILGVDKGSASRLVSTLARHGYAGKDEVTRCYHLGPCDIVQVFDLRGKKVGSIGISEPATRISPGCLLELDAIVVEVGKVLSERTAFIRDQPPAIYVAGDFLEISDNYIAHRATFRGRYESTWQTPPQ